MNSTNDTNIFVSGSGTASDPYTYNYHATAISYSGHTQIHIDLAIWVAIFLSLFLIRRWKNKKGEFWLLIMAFAPVLFFCFAAACAILKILISN